MNMEPKSHIRINSARFHNTCIVCSSLHWDTYGQQVFFSHHNATLLCCKRNNNTSLCVSVCLVDFTAQHIFSHSQPRSQQQVTTNTLSRLDKLHKADIPHIIVIIHGLEVIIINNIIIPVIIVIRNTVLLAPYWRILNQTTVQLVKLA